jgi:hypothetical protein
VNFFEHFTGVSGTLERLNAVDQVNTVIAQRDARAVIGYELSVFSRSRANFWGPRDVHADPLDARVLLPEIINRAARTGSKINYRVHVWVM